MTTRWPDTVAVIPALNEAGTIAAVVAPLMRTVPVIVVDDGSTDDTAVCAERAGATVVRNPENLGYDAALGRGFAEAQRAGMTRVITLDADGEHVPGLVAVFAEALQEVSMVIGCRPCKQRVTERLFGAYTALRYGVHDILCGMKGYELTLYEANDGWDHCGSIGTELTLFALARQVPFREIPVHGLRRQDQPRFGRTLRANARILGAMMRVIRRTPGSGQALREG